MSKRGTPRPLGLETLENRVALANSVFISIVMDQTRDDVRSVIVYRFIANEIRPTQYRKDSLAAEGEGADGSKHELPVGQAIREPSTSLGSTIRKEAITPSSVVTPNVAQNHGLIVSKPIQADSPVERVVSGRVTGGSPSDLRDTANPSLVGQKYLPTPGTENASWTDSDTRHSMQSGDSPRIALRTSLGANASHPQIAPNAMFASLTQKGVSMHKKPSLEPLAYVLQSQSESQRDLAPAIRSPSNGMGFHQRMHSKHDSRTTDLKNDVELNRILVFSKYGTSNLTPNLLQPSESDQLPTIIGVARSLDNCLGDAFGPDAQIARGALLALVSEFEQGFERSDDPTKAADYRGISTAGSVLVAAYAASLARRSRKRYPKQECDAVVPLTEILAQSRV